MKKSQLRNIIRESINELMTEQGSCQMVAGTNTTTGPNGNLTYGISNIQDAMTALQNGNYHWEYTPAQIAAGCTQTGYEGYVGVHYWVCTAMAEASGYGAPGSSVGNWQTGMGTMAWNSNFFTDGWMHGGQSLLDAANDPNSGYYDMGDPNMYSECQDFMASGWQNVSTSPNAMDTGIENPGDEEETRIRRLPSDPRDRRSPDLDPRDIEKTQKITNTKRKR